MTKISELPVATSVSNADVIPIVQSGVTKQASKALVGESIQNEAGRWTLIDTGKYTATPASTSSITMSDTSGFAVGLPVKYTYNGTTFYGICTAVTADTSITIAGATLNTGVDLTALSVGVPELVVVMPIFVPEEYADDTTTTLIFSDSNFRNRWKGPKAFLVQFEFRNKTADTSGAPRLNVTIDGSSVGTENANNGIDVTGTGWNQTSAVAISTTNYDVSWEEEIEIAVNTAGTTGDAANLTANLVFILE